MLIVVPYVGIMTLEKEGQPPLTVNVEYNQIDALLKDSGKEGDVNDPGILSPVISNL